MDFKDLIKKRRSVRKYSDKPIEDSVVDAILEATLTAPSSRNSRSTHLMVIRNREIIDNIATMRDSATGFVKGAPLMILVMGDKTVTDMWEINSSISATIMQLAVVDLGLESCWVHVDKRTRVKSEPNGEMAENYLRTLVDIPEHFGVLCGICIGYSDFHPAALPTFDAVAHVSKVE